MRPQSRRLQSQSARARPGTGRRSKEFVVVIETPIVSCRVKHDDAVVVSPFTDAKNAITSIAIKVRAAVRFAIFLIHRLFPSGVDLAPTRVEDDDAR